MFLKTTLTVPKIKDLVNYPNQKYENIYNTISHNSNSNSYCVIIKIWFKNNYGNNGSIDKYMNEDINKMIKIFLIKLFL